MQVWQPCRITQQKGIGFYVSLCFDKRATVDRIADAALDVVTRQTPYIDGMITSLVHRRHRDQHRRHRDQLIHRSALVSYQDFLKTRVDRSQVVSRLTVHWLVANVSARKFLLARV